ncbi:MAG: hypothetical protein HY318_02175, partial [Armatimonadetes bacterium]|nr:hypothetical protein [Armatimonadota bacterium]
MTRRIAWFGDIDALHKNLTLLPRLKEEMGLNTLLPESGVTHTSGFRISREVEGLNPLARWREKPGLADHHRAFGHADHVFACVPGIVVGADDTALNAILDAAHSIGMEVWGHAGLWCYGGEVFPELAMRDVDGEPFPASQYASGWGFCPSRPELPTWLRACFAEATREYPIDGWFVDHARWPAPANWPSLWGCACDHCAEKAAGLGYDFEKITAAARQAKQRFRELETETVRRAARADVTPSGLLRILDLDDSILDWFRFRADLLAAKMKELRDSVRAVRPIPFGADVFPPTVALLGGHNYETWASGADYVTGGVGALLAWGTAAVRAAAEWARVLLEFSPAIPESDAVRMFLHLFGYDRFNLPLSVAGLTDNSQVPVADMTAYEFRQLREQLPGNLAAYP